VLSLNYLMSDLNGEYEKYLAMLDKIAFSPDDTLYILGNVMDYGPEPMRLVRDLMGRENVCQIMGDRDYAALTLLHQLTDEDCPSAADAAMLRRWRDQGGSGTIEGFLALVREEQNDILDYLSDLPLYEAAEIGDRIFLMVHAGLGNFDPARSIRDYDLQELAFTPLDMDRDYFEDKSVYIICGHRPTRELGGGAEIVRRGNNICVNCGVSRPDGRLACLCLDSMEEFYI